MQKGLARRYAGRSIRNAKQNKFPVAFQQGLRLHERPVDPRMQMPPGICSGGLQRQPTSHARRLCFTGTGLGGVRANTALKLLHGAYLLLKKIASWWIMSVPHVARYMLI